MEWTNYMSTGEDGIDDQHKELFRYLNDIGEAVRGKKDSEEIAKILQDAADYTKKHFDFEEALVAKHNCPMQDVNKKAHEQYKKTFSQMIEDYKKEASLAIGIKAHRELTNWLFDHIIKIDKNMVANISA